MVLLYGVHLKTDITGVLVMALFIMLGILFVTFSNTLTKKTTSTSTRASDVSSRNKSLSSDIAYGDLSCPTGQKSWFGVCIAVNTKECVDKCLPAKSVADKTSYGKETCSSKIRCLPLGVANTVKGYFNFGSTSAVNAFCEKVTAVSGAVCYTTTGINNIKNISKYDMFYAGENSNNAAYFKKKFTWWGLFPDKYKIECPMYVTFVNGGIDKFLELGNADTNAVDYIESGYCYVPKSITPTPIK